MPAKTTTYRTISMFIAAKPYEVDRETASLKYVALRVQLCNHNLVYAVGAAFLKERHNEKSQLIVNDEAKLEVLEQNFFPQLHTPQARLAEVSSLWSMASEHAEDLKRLAARETLSAVGVKFKKAR